MIVWDELLLGGAVKRYGIDSWDVVAYELRARTLNPNAFTPEACKIKYEDLQKRYSGSTDWFEEMRKQRIAELKREVSKSDETIRSLESKLKSLELEEGNSNSNHIESHSPHLDSNGNESFAKETTFKDEQSAGSFTEDKDKDKDIELEKTPEFRYGQVVTTKKRRGVRRRKDCTNAFREVSVGENENLGSSNVASTTLLDKLTIDLAQATKDESLMEIFNSITQTEPAGVFKHRMDSQKRARYRKIINEHLDLGTVRSRITSESITSSKELFRDLLLLANNALVFYSSRTREHKAALSLRNLVMEEYKKKSRGTSHEATSSTFNLCNRPVKPRSARPRPRSLPCKDIEVLERLSNDEMVKEEAMKKPCESDNNVPLGSSSKDRKAVRRPGVKLKTSSSKPRRRVRK